MTVWDVSILCTKHNMHLPMSISWLCCRVSPLLCSCSELFQGRLHMICLLEVRQIQSGHLPLGQGFLKALRKQHYNSKWKHLEGPQILHFITYYMHVWLGLGKNIDHNIQRIQWSPIPEMNGSFQPVLVMNSLTNFRQFESVWNCSVDYKT